MYCITCKENTQDINPKVLVSKKGRPMIQAICANCARTKSQFTSKTPMVIDTKIKAQSGGCAGCNGKCGKPVMKGDGIIDAIQRFFSGPRKDKAPPSVRKIIESEGSQKIVQMAVCREPIMSVIQKIVDFFSIKKTYDQLFHLYALVKLQNGKTYRIEKNEVIKISPSAKEIDKDCQRVSGNFPTLGELFINGEKKVGTERFFQYDGVKYNCQDFILALLQGSKLGDQQLYNFIKQDAEDILPSILETGFRKVTDIAGALDRAVQGEGLQKRPGIKF